MRSKYKGNGGKNDKLIFQKSRHYNFSLFYSVLSKLDHTEHDRNICGNSFSHTEK
jgi:hypothetical protein